MVLELVLYVLIVCYVGFREYLKDLGFKFNFFYRLIINTKVFFVFFFCVIFVDESVIVMKCKLLIDFSFIDLNSLVDF